MSSNSHTFEQTLSEIGLALVLTFIPIGMYAKVFFGTMIIGNALMVVGFLLLFPYSVVKKEAKVKLNKAYKYYFFFFILCYVYLFLSNSSNYDIAKEVLYLGVPLATCLELANTNYAKDIKLPRVIFFTWLFSIVCVLAGLYFSHSGMREATDYAMFGDEKIYDDLTAGGISIINICCSLYLCSLFGKRPSLQIVFIACIILDFHHIVITGKRTPLIVAVAVVILWNQELLKKISLRTKILLCGLIVASIIFLANYQGHNTKLLETTGRIIEGIRDLILGTDYDATNSTAIRYYTRKTAISELASYNIFELILGKGYMHKWLDIPILQAYMDMGILGLVLFTKNIVILPFKAIFFYSKHNKNIMWASLLCLYGMLGILTTGTPYGHGQWTSLAVLLFVLIGEKKKRKKGIIHHNSNYNSND